MLLKSSEMRQKTGHFRENERLNYVFYTRINDETKSLINGHCNLSI